MVNVTVLILGDAAELCLPPDSPTRMDIVGLKGAVAKLCSTYPLGGKLGFQTPLSQQEQYSPNAFLERNAFPHAFHSLCQHSCA